MATPQQIADLRTMISQPDNVAPYTDEALAARIDAASGLQALAGAIWREKAGTYAGLVDVQEGSSRRALGSLYANALKMAEGFDSLVAAAGGSTGRPARTRAIERP